MDFDLLPNLLGDSSGARRLPEEQFLTNLPRSILTSNPRGLLPQQDDDVQDQLSSTAPENIYHAGFVICKIEDVFEAMADCIIDEKKELVIHLKSRHRPAFKGRNAVSGAIENLPDSQIRSITFPSKKPQEAWKFTALLRILELAHEALVNGVVTTKRCCHQCRNRAFVPVTDILMWQVGRVADCISRDMFYRDPDLFIKQAVVDRYIDDIAYTLGVNRDALNVVAAAKGLVAGSFSIEKKDKSIVDFSSDSEGLLVPNSKDIDNVLIGNVRWILVIEKEATFRTLSTNHYWKLSSAGEGILLTAKGYPDIQTRKLLYILSEQRPAIPIFALVDFDPDGIGIMSTYKYGSMALSHENSKLAVPGLEWLGIRSRDIVSTSTGVMKLSSRDRNTARRMLDKDIFQEGERDEEWRVELQRMLFLNAKAEIQTLGNSSNLEAWLNMQLWAAV
ncbi:hypothetical protein BP5796_06233 [Coleophoma crateriformis]|uniref:DNA topoisomerase (ATP-hydrolyzing) n=1 Tax=Coleophoma crateriformis TaxID=565419 RepID=A0A3D8RX44_9HELO|nr:hypothetical protein BP5796_06233 [Coleophoma crateriformis]